MSEMPKDIWVNSAEFKLIDALRQKEPHVIGSCHYTRTDIIQSEHKEMQAAIRELRSVTKILKKTLKVYMEHHNHTFGSTLTTKVDQTLNNTKKWSEHE